jgi:hypothetical protein
MTLIGKAKSLKHRGTEGAEEFRKFEAKRKSELMD